MANVTLEEILRLRAELPSRETSVPSTEEEIKQPQTPCQCVLWERGTEQDRETFVRTFRFTLPYMSEEEARQFNQMCLEIGIKMQYRGQEMDESISTWC
jgi:hypothetical protein